VAKLAAQVMSRQVELSDVLVSYNSFYVKSTQIDELS